MSKSAGHMSMKKCFRRKITRFLKGTYNHYLSIYPAPLPNRFLRLFHSVCKRVQLPEACPNDLARFQKEGILVFVNKYQSYLEQLFMAVRYETDNIPYPKIGFGYKFLWFQQVSELIRILLSHWMTLVKHRRISDPYENGFFESTLQAKQPALLSLIEKKNLYRLLGQPSRDPLRFLLDFQMEIETPIFLVPQNFFFTHAPPREKLSIREILLGSEDHPGKIYRLAMFLLRPEKIFIEHGETINLKTYLEGELQKLEGELQKNDMLSSTILARKLRRSLIEEISKHRQSVVGPVRKTREELCQDILTSDRLQSYLQQYAESRNASLSVTYRHAEEYLQEIAAGYNAGVIKVGCAMVQWITNNLFDGISLDSDELQKIREAARQAPLILVPCHKSHMDYMTLSYVMGRNKMPFPLIAAGKNLSFFPMGPLFRAAGAFFIRRSFRGAVLYSRMLSEYIYKIIKEGFNLEFFIEGGRSRTGKLAPPKLGLLSIILNAVRDGANNDLIFVPVYIGYDQVVEEDSYIRELSGEEKEPENIKQVIGARKFLRKRHGRIYLRFSNPFSLRELSHQYGLASLEETPQKELNAFCRHLGHRLVNAIDRVTVVSPHSIMAPAILNSKENEFSYSSLMTMAETYLAWIHLEHALLAETLEMDPLSALRKAFQNYVSQKNVIPITDKGEAHGVDPTYRIVEQKRPNLEYYKNNAIYFFMPAAITAQAILQKDADTFSASDLTQAYNDLMFLFKNEFTFDMDTLTDDKIVTTLSNFTKMAILTESKETPNQYHMSSAQRAQLFLFSKFLQTYFEAYKVVLLFFMSTHDATLNSIERLEKIKQMGQYLFERKEISRIETMSIVTFENAMDFFVSQGIKSIASEEKARPYQELIKQNLFIYETETRGNS